MSPKNEPDFPAVHTRLRSIVEAYNGRGLQAKADAENYILTGPVTENSLGREVWFGGVQTRKNYVSFHLMPVYAFPELLQTISPALKKRMQGKSCFNFTKIDESLFSELSDLVETGYQRFKDARLIL
jgi:hypothetical protein